MLAAAESAPPVESVGLSCDLAKRVGAFDVSFLLVDLVDEHLVWLTSTAQAEYVHAAERTRRPGATPPGRPTTSSPRCRSRSAAGWSSRGVTGGVDTGHKAIAGDAVTPGAPVKRVPLAYAEGVVKRVEVGDDGVTAQVGRGVGVDGEAADRLFLADLGPADLRPADQQTLQSVKPSSIGASAPSSAIAAAACTPLLVACPAWVDTDRGMSIRWWTTGRYDGANGESVERTQPDRPIFTDRREGDTLSVVSTPTERSVDFPPLANGLDYLADAVGRLTETPSARDLKYAVLHLHAGVEVLLKYRLICVDWRLILEDSKDGEPAVTYKRYKAGKFRSIGIGKALKRLQDPVGITVTKGQKKAANALDKFRNQLQHYGLTDTDKAIEAQAVKVLEFILDFIDTHITPDIHLTEADKQALADAMPGIRSALGTITALVDQRMQRLRPDLEQAWTAWCPDCGQLAVLLENDPVDRSHGPEDDQPRCVFCTAHWDSRADYVDDFTGSRLGLSGGYEAMTNGGDPPTEHCPECGADMLVWFDPATGELGPNLAAQCFYCGCEFNDRCPRCDVALDTPAVNDPDDGGMPRDKSMLCANCLEDL